MSSWEESRSVERDPAKVSGAWVFANTRVPMRALFEKLEDGATVDQFVEWFPGVTREQVEAVLEFAAAELRKQIRAAAVDQAQATDASLLIVLTADLKAWKKSPERYWRNAAPEIQKLVTGWMGPFYEGKEQLQRDEAMRSCGIAGQTIMLAAKAMGYDSCPMIGFDPVKVAEIINLPSDHVISFMIAVGKAVKPAWPKGGQFDLAEVVVENRFA